MPRRHPPLLLSCLCLTVLGSGCSSDVARINAHQRFASKWVLTHKNEGKGLLDLEVDGERYAVHWVQEDYSTGGYPDPKNPYKYDANMKNTVRTESDVLFDGKALWQFNQKYPPGDSRARKGPTVLHYVPPKGIPKGYPGRFWAIPDEFELSRMDPATQGGVTYRVYEDRTDMPGNILGYVVHPDGYLKQFSMGTSITRQVSTDSRVVGHQTQTFQTNLSTITVTYKLVQYKMETRVFESTDKSYECVEFKPLESVDSSHFQFTPHGEKVEEVTDFGWW